MARDAKIWMPLYIGDYLSDTQHLSAEQSGGYLHLLMHSWKNGPLPASEDSLRMIARIERDAWGNAWGILQAFFKQCSDGTWIQSRLERERDAWDERKAEAVKKAANAAKKRWVDASSNASSNAQALLGSCPLSSPSPSPYSNKSGRRASEQQKPNPLVGVSQTVEEIPPDEVERLRAKQAAHEKAMKARKSA